MDAGGNVCRAEMESVESLRSFLEEHFPGRHVNAHSNMAAIWTTMDRLVDILGKHARNPE